MFRRDFLLTSFLSFFGLKTKIPKGLNEVEIKDNEIINGEALFGDAPFDKPFVIDLKIENKFTFYRSKIVWLRKENAIRLSDQIPEPLFSLTKIENNLFKKFYGEMLLLQILFIKKEGHYSNFYLYPNLNSQSFDIKLEDNKKKYKFEPGNYVIKQIPNNKVVELALEEFFK